MSGDEKYKCESYGSIIQVTHEMLLDDPPPPTLVQRLKINLITSVKIFLFVLAFAVGLIVTIGSFIFGMFYIASLVDDYSHYWLWAYPFYFIGIIFIFTCGAEYIDHLDNVGKFDNLKDLWRDI